MVLCHGCLEEQEQQHPATNLSLSLPYPCLQGYCLGSVRYCSDECRYENSNRNEPRGGGGGGGGGGHHSVPRCKFIGRYCCPNVNRRIPRRRPRRRGVDDKNNGEKEGDENEAADNDEEEDLLVQIALSEEPFPLYQRVDGTSTSSSASTSIILPRYEPTGKTIHCRIGDVGQVILGPNEIDAGGSVLVQLSSNNTTTTTTIIDNNNNNNNNHSLPPPQVRRANDKETNDTYILCDIPSLEPATPFSVHAHNANENTRNRSNQLWIQGIQFWYNQKSYLQAMRCFESSLNSFRWCDEDCHYDHCQTNTRDDDDGDGNDNGNTASSSQFFRTKEELDDFLSLPPPVRTTSARRQVLARRAYFLGMCYNDASRITEARLFFLRALVTKPRFGCYRTAPNQQGVMEEEEEERLREGSGGYDDWNECYTELMLGYEEEGNVAMARCVASWSMEDTDINNHAEEEDDDENGWLIGKWVDVYQRPGVMIVSTMKEEHQMEDLIKAYYSPQEEEGGYYPSWCGKLEEHYDTIKEEFMELFLRKRGTNAKNKWMKDTNRIMTKSVRQASLLTVNESQQPQQQHQPALPLHWPQVGSGKHRPTGHNDSHVVRSSSSSSPSSFGDSAATKEKGGGGDWRELVLFGSGCTTSIAPKTRALIRKYVPDAVTLAEMGGGEVIFSVLGPHTHIAPHCASTNIRLTAHLGLIVPSTSTTSTTSCDGVNDLKSDHERETNHDRNKCAIRVRDKWHTWTEGKFLVFDDSYEHEVINSTDSIRAVLLIRFWHPMIQPQYRMRVMECILQQRTMEERKRYVPPLPPGFEHVEQRGLGKTLCTSCGRTGYSDIRVFAKDDEEWMDTKSNYQGGVAFEPWHQNNLAFACVCGQPILSN